MNPRCPGCFQHLPNEAFLWICRSGRCPTTADPTASAYTGSDVSNPPMVTITRPDTAPKGWQPTVSVHCPSCKEEAAEACILCHHVLLPGWRLAHSTFVAMNGARATGKSLFIAVLIKQLDELLAKSGTTVTPADASTQNTYSKVYEEPLFVERGLMAPTGTTSTASAYQREPLIFSLGNLNGKLRYLVIRDVAGEDMENPPPNSQPLAFLAHADAVFFMFDPLAVPDIRNVLQDLVPGQLTVGGDPDVVLANLLRIIGPANPRLAVILSKFDAMHELRNVEDVQWQSVMSNSGAAFVRDPSLETAHYEENDGELLHHEVHSLLHKLGATKLVRNLENPHRGVPFQYRYFAVSALGDSPNGSAVSPRGIAPFRCLDPLKWVLSSNNSI